MAIIKGGKTLAPWKKSYDKHRQCLKKQRHHFADKSPYSQSYGFSGSYVWMWELDHKERLSIEELMLLNWDPWEDSWESLDSKELKPVNPKGNQPWILFGRTDAEAKAPILWLPDVKSWLIGKDPDAGKDWGQEEQGAAEEEMVGWHHRLDGNEFE